MPFASSYNALTRSVEFEATAAFRELGIRSYHYNPLGGGMLTGKFKAFDQDDEDRAETRMGKCGPTSNYSNRYWKQQYFDALESLRTVCEAEGVPMAEAALRWCRHHSVLSPKHGDGFIIGASSLEHAVANLDAASKGPLPEAIVTAYDEAWKITEPVAHKYFRGYSSETGKSDTFLLMHQDSVPNS